MADPVGDSHLLSLPRPSMKDVWKDQQATIKCYIKIAQRHVPNHFVTMILILLQNCSQLDEILPATLANISNTSMELSLATRTVETTQN